MHYNIYSGAYNSYVALIKQKSNGRVSVDTVLQVPNVAHAH